MPGTVVSVTRPATQDLLKRLAELWAEHRVDDGVEGGVEVAKPSDEHAHLCLRKYLKIRFNQE